MQTTQETRGALEVQGVQDEAQDDVRSGGVFPAAAGLAVVATAALTACGGGGDDPASPTAAGGDDRAAAQALLPGGSGSTAQVAAWRFLNQATMGPTAAEISWVTTNGIEAWLTRQFAYTQPTISYAANYLLRVENKPDWQRHMTHAWWRLALGSADQLRQRVVNSLIEILVISMRDEIVGFRPYMAAGYMDVLARHAFGNFRELIEAVCKAPAMGAYLSHFGNRPPEAGRRIPDQNFARELIQLFTIGLNQLNMDGTPVLDGNGRPVSSTRPTDIPLLSNVFTGWALDDNPALDTTINYVEQGVAKSQEDRVRWYGDYTDAQRSGRYVLPMKGYTQHHSTQAQMEAQVGFAAGTATFLGEPFTLGATPQESLTKALDVIFRHPNVAPFISRQMIMRMVTSNPTAAYVQRVATAFKSGNWSMQALIRAILTDTEARSASAAAGTTYGKLREPLLRITHLLRAFGVTDASPANSDRVADFWVATNLNQGEIRAPSVFNHFSPNYRFAGGDMARQGKVAPEMQIASEASIVAYINAVYDIVANGMTQDWANSRSGQLQITEEVNAAASPSAVVALINKKLFGGAMSSALVSHLTTACTPAAGGTATATERVRAAIFLAAVSPEYLVQK